MSPARACSTAFRLPSQPILMPLNERGWALQKPRDTPSGLIWESYVCVGGGKVGLLSDSSEG